MANKSIKSNEALARKIKERRTELKLTIEEAATRAGVGTKTWSRYEAGEAIRADKCKGICRALNWNGLPGVDDVNEATPSISEYRNHEAWSPWLEKNYGFKAALSFAIGSDIVFDNIRQDLEELSEEPVGTHIGQLDISWLNGGLPEQFRMLYNYDFLYQMRCTLHSMRMCAKVGQPMTAHSVLEELILYLCNEETIAMIELGDGIFDFDDYEEIDSDEWIYDLFGDKDIVTWLYSDIYVDESNQYHFSHWAERQFYTE